MYTGPHIITDGLVLSLDAGNTKSYPGSGTAWTDKSGFGNNGTLTNTPGFSSANGGTLVFDGVNDYVDCGNPSSLNFGTGDFTVSVWVKRFDSSTTNLRLLSKGSEDNSSGQSGFTLFGGNTEIGFSVNPSGTRTIITAATYSIGEWFNVVGVLERSTNIRAYKNANLTTSTTAPIGSITGTSNLFIGRSTSALLPWIGNISNVQIYNRALTSQEIQQNYSSTKTRYGL